MLTCLQGPVKLLVQVRLAHPVDRRQNGLHVISAGFPTRRDLRQAARRL